MKPITHHHLKLIDAAEAIRLDPDKTEAAFIARQLVQATFEAVNLNWVIASHSSCGNLALVLRLAEESAAMQNDCVTRWRDYSGQQEGA
jgi:hypothetical protein